jgi:hypothetical protein
MRRASQRLAILVGCWAFLAAPAVARADAAQEGTFWPGYMSSWWVDPNWALWFDTHYNLDTFFVGRIGVTRRLEAGPTVTGGYAFLLLNPDFERYEHRAWGQIFLPVRFDDRWSVSGRFRVDLRWLESLEDGRITDSWDFRFRPRWQTTFTRRFKPISIGQPLAQFAHEILINAASSTDLDVLDQNRFSLLFGVEMPHVTVRVGYMNRWLPNARGGDGRMEHAALLWFTQSVELFEKKRGYKEPEYDMEDYPEMGTN